MGGQGLAGCRHWQLVWGGVTGPIGPVPWVVWVNSQSDCVAGWPPGTAWVDPACSWWRSAAGSRCRRSQSGSSASAAETTITWIPVTGVHRQDRTRQAFTGWETNKTSIHTVRDYQDRCSSERDHQVKTGIHRVRDQQDKYSQCKGPPRQDIHTVEGPPRQTVTLWKDHQDKHSHCGRTTKTNIHTVEGPPRQTFTLWKDHQDKHSHCGRTMKTNIHTVEGPPRQIFTLWKDHQDKHSHCGRTT